MATDQDTIFDFFIIYAKPDCEKADALYAALNPQTQKIFLDHMCLSPSQIWPLEISKALTAAKIIVIVISNNVQASHFAQEELHTAINLMRHNPRMHKIVPVLYNGVPAETDHYYYGLRLIQGLDATNLTASQIADQLIALAHDEQLQVMPATERRHVLEPFPPGPLVPGHLIPRSLIDSYSSLIKSDEATLVINEANALKIDFDRNTQYTIKLNRIPSPLNVPAFPFWVDTFDYARLQGPRMLAALLLVVPDDMFEKTAREERRALLHRLQDFNS